MQQNLSQSNKLRINYGDYNLFTSYNVLKPLRFDRYTPKLIWGSRKKFQKSNDQSQQYKVIRIKEFLVVVPYRPKNKWTLVRKN